METQTLAIDTPKVSDTNIGREWNSRYGRQRIIGMLEGPTTNLYEVQTIDKQEVRRYSQQSIEDVIRRNEHEITPAHQGECEQREQHHRLHTEQLEKAEKELASTNEKIREFTAAMNYPAFEAGRARGVLSKQLNFKGKILALAELVSQLIAQGRKPCVSEEDKIKPMTRRAFNRASQREQDEHERKVATAGKISRYTLDSDDGYSLDVGAVGYRYAWYLYSKKPSQSGIQCDSCKGEQQCSPHHS